MFRVVHLSRAVSVALVFAGCMRGDESWVCDWDRNVGAAFKSSRGFILADWCEANLFVSSVAIDTEKGRMWTSIYDTWGSRR